MSIAHGRRGSHIAVEMLWKTFFLALPSRVLSERHLTRRSHDGRGSRQRSMGMARMQDVAPIRVVSPSSLHAPLVTQETRSDP